MLGAHRQASSLGIALSAADQAKILTWEQADSVRNFVVSKQAINSLAGFETPEVAAVGFGSQPPAVGANDPGTPSRRVEVILFTPKT